MPNFASSLVLRDRRILYGAAFVRALATGLMGVLLAIYLVKRGFQPFEIGIIVSAGLLGAAVAALVVTLSDVAGQRRMLVVVALFGALGGLVLSFSLGFYATTAAAFLGMVNGMGRDRGASLILDQAMLSENASDMERTRIFAWYNVLQDVGHALGALIAGMPALFHGMGEDNAIASLQAAVWIYAGILLTTVFLYEGLAPRRAEQVSRKQPPISFESRKILWKIASLFALDSMASGFLTTALLSFFFYERFGISVGLIGMLFFGARVANVGSHLAAAWLAKRIGLVNTMVFTHIPSSLLLMTVAFAPSFSVAAILFLLREGLVEMDVPTRQSYVMAVVKPEERTFVSGVTHIVRMGAWAVAPAFAGALMKGASFNILLFVGASMKIVYDLLLYISFRRLRPPEEQRLQMEK